MGPTAVDREAWLDRHTDRWVDAGLISSDQADAIQVFEDVHESAPRLTVVAEVATYLGSIIALGGGAAIVAPNWSQLGVAGQLALAAVIAVVGFVAGHALIALDEDGTQRLGSFLQVIGTGGVALGVGVVVGQIDPRNESWYAIAIGAAVLVVGLGLWRNLDRPLQLVTAAVGVSLFVGGLYTLVGLSTLHSAIVTWVGAGTFGAITAAGVVTPRTTAFGIAAIGMMSGAFRLAAHDERLSAIVAVASAATIVIVALLERSWLLVAIGLGAFLMAITALMGTVLEGTLARLVAVAAGLAVVAFVAIRAQHQRTEP